MDKLDILPTATHHPFFLPRAWKWTMISSLFSHWLEVVYNHTGKTADFQEHLRLQHPLQTGTARFATFTGTLTLRTFVPCPAFWLLIRLISGKSEILLLHPFFWSLLFTMYLCCLPCCQLWHCSNDRIRISQFNSQEWQRIKSGQVNREREECGNGDGGKDKLVRIAKAFFLWQPDFNFIQWSEVTGGVGITAWATSRYITHLKTNIPILIEWWIDAVSQEGCSWESTQLSSPASLSTSHPEEEIQNCQSRQDAGLSTCCVSWARHLNTSIGRPLKGLSVLEGKLPLQNIMPSCRQIFKK